jgi:hypothetical protein
VFLFRFTNTRGPPATPCGLRKQITAEFAASIVGIVSIGTRLSLTLYQLAADIGDAATEARIVAGEIRSLCSVVKTLSETLEKVQDSQYYAHCAEMTKVRFSQLRPLSPLKSQLLNLKIGDDGRESGNVYRYPESVSRNSKHVYSKRREIWFREQSAVGSVPKAQDCAFERRA